MFLEARIGLRRTQQRWTRQALRPLVRPDGSPLQLGSLDLEAASWGRRRWRCLAGGAMPSKPSSCRFEAPNLRHRRNWDSSEALQRRSRHHSEPRHWRTGVSTHSAARPAAPPTCPPRHQVRRSSGRDHFASLPRGQSPCPPGTPERQTAALGRSSAQPPTRPRGRRRSADWHAAAPGRPAPPPPARPLGRFASLRWRRPARPR
mmetsp:Transcript_51055/g.108464  ORF Transcript_51055/g.108464 Transcript_51055/m.108464 type:complete len:204 (+) Transcript_51055:258-869(+)